jgi:uncharacterized protein involved in type VI secretion and phage assembly
MPQGLVESTANSAGTEDRAFYGVTAATVIDNEDCGGQVRVQVRISWLPGYEPWARVATPMAGKGRGAFFIPQKDDEVLIAFTQGDVMEPYVIGSLWNDMDKAPALNPKDATDKRVIRTPRGHELEFDDAAESIRLTSNAKREVKIEKDRIVIAIGGRTATISLDKDGNIAITSARGIKLAAPEVTIQGDNFVDIKAGSQCRIKGGKVFIN